MALRSARPAGMRPATFTGDYGKATGAGGRRTGAACPYAVGMAHPDQDTAHADAGSYRATDRAIPTRHRERAAYDRETVHAILDEALVCHLGFVSGGEPVVLPTLHARVGEQLYMHGSTGSGPLRLVAGDGLTVCVTVTLIDGLVLARSAFHHSVNYRSVVVRGRARLLDDDTAKRQALDAVLDKVADGRSGDCRPPTAKELAATAVLALDLDEVSAKVRAGGVADDAEDMELPYWAGVVPLRTTAGRPLPDPDLPADIRTPTYLTGPGQSPELNAESKAAEGGEKLSLRTNSSASGAPVRRSMPASSHSIEMGPS